MCCDLVRLILETWRYSFLIPGDFCENDIDECSGQPCLNDGICIQPEPGRFECQCPDGVEGDNCETIGSATFSGTTVLQVPFGGGAAKRKKRQAQPVTIQLMLMTTVDTGVLFFAQGVSYDYHKFPWLKFSSNAFSWMKMFVFWLKLHWSFVPKCLIDNNPALV